jgi:hypothetical protein
MKWEKQYHYKKKLQTEDLFNKYVKKDIFTSIILSFLSKKYIKRLICKNEIKY